MQTTAVKDGKGNYVLNGEKWFSSAASAADIAVVMAKTNPDAPRHQQFSTFIVELPNPGYQIVRDIPTMAVHGAHYEEMGGGHSEVRIDNLIVPEENLLGGEGGGFSMGQHRLAYGRLRHGMHNVAMAQRALDLATEHVTKRTTFGKGLEDRQGVQFMLAECASELYIARLMLMHIAYKAENGMDLRRDPAPRRPRLQPRYATRCLVHAHPLPASRRRTGRSAQVDHRQERHPRLQEGWYHGRGRRRRPALGQTGPRLTGRPFR